MKYERLSGAEAGLINDVCDKCVCRNKDRFCNSIALVALIGEGEGEGEVAFFRAKSWNRRSRTDLIESATPCHDAHVVGSYRVSNPLRLIVLAANSEDYTTAPQHL